MDGGVNAVLQQMSWHDGGLFMGMHWMWWLVSLGAFCLLAWAFVRLYADRAEIRRRAKAATKPSGAHQDWVENQLANHPGFARHR